MSDYSVKAILSAVDQGFTSTLDSAVGSISKVENAATKIGSGMSSVGKAMTVGLTTPIVTAGGAAIKMSSDFETAMAKVETLADTTEVPISALQSQIIELSSSTGKSATEIADAVYQAISAGQSTGEAVNFVTNASKLAVGGFTDVASATDVLTTVLNAYGLEASDVTKISDMLITTQNEGKTTVDELGAVMGKVIPTAAMFGVNMDQLSSAFVTTTKNGIGTAESATYINSMLNELGKSGTTVSDVLKDKTGKSFAELMADGWTLTDVLQVVQDEATASGMSMADMFGSAEAGKAAAVMVQHTEDFDGALVKMNTTMGATETAFETMQSTSGAAMEKLKTSAVNALIELGNAILPVVVPAITTLTEKIGELASWFGSLDDSTKNTILTIAGIVAAAGPVLGIVGKGVTLVGGLVGGIGRLGGAATAVQGPTAAAGTGMSSFAQTIMAVGVAVLLVSAGFWILTQAAIQLAAAGWPAIAVMAGLVIGVGALLAVMMMLAPSMTAGAGGIIALGAAVLLCAAGFYVMAAAATMLASSGGAAIAVFFGMIGAIAALMAIAAALGPALIAGGTGALLLGAGLALCGVGALLAAAALAIITSLLPQIAANGTSGAAAIVALSAALVAFGAGATVAGAGAGVAGAGLLVMAAGGVTALASMAGLAVALAAVTAEMTTISSSASSAASDIASMKDGISIVQSGLDALGNLASKAIDALGQSFSKGAQSADQMMSQMNSSLSNGGSKAVSLAKSIASKIPPAFATAVQPAYTSGLMIGTGLANGLEAAAGRVRAQAAALAAAADAAIQAKAKIGSPSRVARKDGRWFGEGFGLGIGDMESFVEKMSANLVNIPNMAAAGFNGRLNSEYSYGNGSTVVINVPLEVDGKQFAKATAVYTQSELNTLNARGVRVQGMA